VEHVGNVTIPLYELQEGEAEPKDLSFSVLEGSDNIRFSGKWSKYGIKSRNTLIGKEENIMELQNVDIITSNGNKTSIFNMAERIHALKTAVEGIGFALGRQENLDTKKLCEDMDIYASIKEDAE
jgi:hypothetical protein